jgi:hypothetical protein
MPEADAAKRVSQMANGTCVLSKWSELGLDGESALEQVLRNVVGVARTKTVEHILDKHSDRRRIKCKEHR